MPTGDRLEKLTIENFAGIRRLEMDVSPFTVLIGPQSVGKSLTAKALYFLRSLPWVLYHAAGRDNPLESDEAVIKAFTELFLPQVSSSKATLRWSGTSRTEIKVGIDAGGRISVSIPDAMRNAYDALRRQAVHTPIPDFGKDLFWADRERLKAEEVFWSTVANLMPEAVNGMHFIPAVRSFYSVIQRDAASFYTLAQLDPIIVRFGTLLAGLKKKNPSAKSSACGDLANKLLGGVYLREGNEDFIVLPDGIRLPISAWSSGQQEAYPLAFILQYVCSGEFRQDLFVEEPEAHLFPTSQRIITELISLAFNARQSQTRFFLTTHSPYILTTMNNLLQAGLLYSEGLSEEKRKNLSEIIPPDRALTPGSVAVFYMDRDSCRSIMDEETGLIGTSEIDEASGLLSEQFDALLETQPS